MCIGYQETFPLLWGWLLTSFSRFDKEYLPSASISALLTLPLPHCPLIYKPTKIFLGDRCTLLLVFFCIGNGRLDAKLCSCFFGCLASLSVCHGMMFSLIEYLIAYSLVWILSRMLWKSKWKQADNFHLSHVCWHVQRVLIDWNGFANALPESLLYLQLSDILSFQSCFHHR